MSRSKDSRETTMLMEGSDWDDKVDRCLRGMMWGPAIEIVKSKVLKMALLMKTSRDESLISLEATVNELKDKSKQEIKFLKERISKLEGRKPRAKKEVENADN